MLLSFELDCSLEVSLLSASRLPPKARFVGPDVKAYNNKEPYFVTTFTQFLCLFLHLKPRHTLALDHTLQARLHPTWVLKETEQTNIQAEESSNSGGENRLVTSDEEAFA